MKLSLLKILPIVLLTACGTNKTFTNLTDSQIDWNKKPLHEGIKAYDKSEFIYSKEGKKLFKIQFSEPVVVAVAEKAYGWGYFQFPSFYQTDDGNIVANWHLAADHAESYGERKLRAGNIQRQGEYLAGGCSSLHLGGGFKVDDQEYIKFIRLLLFLGRSLNLPKPLATAKKPMVEPSNSGKLRTFLIN